MEYLMMILIFRYIRSKIIDIGPDISGEVTYLNIARSEIEK